tara:strand:+ start:376 stop:639 length:264 start_codon:yes stop_codon:yes gene_type:complete
MTATNKELILARFKPCGCGCKGADSWHKPSFRRVVQLTPNNLVGFVQLPFSSIPVKVTRDSFESRLNPGTFCYGLWVVDRNSIVYDR